MDIELCGTTLTGKKLLQLLEKSNKIKVKGHQIEKIDARIVGDGQGFTSKVLRVQLKWSQSANQQLPKSMIVKVIGGTAWELFAADWSEKAKKKFIRDLREAHNVECKIYDYGLNETIPMPVCYGKVPSVGDVPGIIALEDLSDRGTMLPPMSMCIGFSSLEMLNSVLDALASFHAWSVNNTEWQKDIPTLKDLNVWEPSLLHFLDTFEECKAVYSEALPSLDKTKLSECVNVDKYVQIFGSDPKVRYNLPLALVHGDVHAINMMFEKGADSKPRDNLVALIDFQLVHKGCAVEDIAVLIITCAPILVRTGKIEETLKHYVQLFNSKVNSTKDHVKYEDVERAFDEMFAFFALFWTCSIGMIDKIAQQVKLEDDPERKQFQDQLLIDRRSLYQEACKILHW